MVVVAVLGLLAIGVGPRTGLYRTLTVLSGSMEPTIQRGALLIVTPFSAEDVRVGDVITYNAPIGGRPLITHRVVNVSEFQGQKTIRTKGDANDGVDPWIARLTGETAWRARGSIPRLGVLLFAFRSDAGRLLSTAVVPVALAAIWVFQIWRRPTADARAS